MNNVNIAAAPETGIGRALTGAQFNATLANALSLGDKRYNLKKLDRKGISRSKGSKYQAEVTGANDAANAVADAYTQRLGNLAYGANADLESKAQREQHAQQLWNMQSSNANADALAALQRQQAMMNFATGMLGGLLR